MGGLWTQKCVKTLRFLRVLKRLFFGFEAPDGPLGLILAASWANLVPKWGPEMGNKSASQEVKKLRRPFFDQIENGSFARGVLQTARKKVGLTESMLST